MDEPLPSRRERHLAEAAGLYDQLEIIIKDLSNESIDATIRDCNSRIFVGFEQVRFPGRFGPTYCSINIHFDKTKGTWDASFGFFHRRIRSRLSPIQCHHGGAIQFKGWLNNLIRKIKSAR